MEALLRRFFIPRGLETTPLETLRILLVSAAHLIAITMLLFNIPYDLYIFPENHLSVILESLAAIGLTLNLVLFRFTRNYTFFISFMVILVAVVTYCIGYFWLWGEYYASAFFWTLVIIPLSFFLVGFARGFLISFSISTVSALTVLLYEGEKVGYTERIAVLTDYTNLFITFMAMSFFYEWVRKRNEAMIFSQNHGRDAGRHRPPVAPAAKRP